MEFDWSGDIFGMTGWVWDVGAAAAEIDNSIYPGGASISPSGPGNATFTRQGVGSVTISRIGPGSSTITPKTQRN